jgi:uncharacterized ParB-like nuclease family protein
MNLVHTFESFLNEGIANQKLEAAIEKIDSLPVGKIFDDAKRIEGIFKKSQHTWSEVVEAFEKAQDSAKVQQVNLNDIHITQPNIQANKVKKMMADINKTPPINVVQFKNGEKVIYDGHHRLLANWALGENRIKVNLVKI